MSEEFERQQAYDGILKNMEKRPEETMKAKLRYRRTPFYLTGKVKQWEQKKKKDITE